MNVTSLAELQAAVSDGTFAPAGGIITLSPGLYGVDTADSQLRPAPRTGELMILGGAGVTLARILITAALLAGSTVANLAISNVDARAYNTAGTSASANLAIRTIAKLSNIRVASCNVYSRIEGGAAIATTTNIASGIWFAGTADEVSGLIVEDCTFDSLYDGFKAGGAGTILRRCTMSKIWNDCVKISDAAGPVVEDMLFFDKKYGTGAQPLHGDFIQFVNQIAAPVSGTVRAAPMVRRIVALRGDGTAGYDDGQGVFFECAIPLHSEADDAGWNGYWYEGGVIEDVLYVGAMLRAVSVQRWRGGSISRVTAIQDAFSPLLAKPIISLQFCGAMTIANSATWGANAEESPYVAATRTNNVENLYNLSPSQLAALFTAPAYGANVRTLAQARAAWRPAGTLAGSLTGWEATAALPVGGGTTRASLRARYKFKI